MSFRTGILSLVFGCAAAAASAATVSITGDGQFSVAPTDVSDATQTAVAFEQDPRLTIFQEQQDLVLEQSIVFDGGIRLDAGAIVSSFMIFLNGDNLAATTATFDFSSNILGLMTMPGYLNNAANAVLRADGISYGTLDGLELGTSSNDGVVRDSASQISVTMEVFDHSHEFGDWIRVVVEGDDPSQIQFDEQFPVDAAVPLPAAGLLGLFGIASLAALRRRKRAG